MRKAHSKLTPYSRFSRSTPTPQWGSGNAWGISFDWILRSGEAGGSWNNFYNLLKTVKRYKILLMLLLLVVLWLQNCCWADTNAVNTFNSVIAKTDQAVAKIGTGMVKATSFLFFSLLIIGIVWNLIRQATGAALGRTFNEVIKILIIYGFFYFLIDGVQTILNAGLSQWETFAGKIATKVISGPSDIINMAGNFVSQLCDQIKKVFEDAEGLDESFKAIFIVLSYFFIAVFAYVIFLIVAFKMFIAAVAYHFQVLAGLFYLGFAGFDYTRDIAVNYLRSILSLAIRYFGMILLANLSYSVLNGLYTNVTIDNSLDFSYHAMIIMATIVFYMLTAELPTQLASIAGNGGIQSINPSQVSGMAQVAMAATAVGGVKTIGWGLGSTGKAGSKVYQGVRNIISRRGAGVREAAGSSEARQAMDKVNEQARS